MRWFGDEMFAKEGAGQIGSRNLPGGRNGSFGIVGEIAMKPFVIVRETAMGSSGIVR